MRHSRNGEAPRSQRKSKTRQRELLQKRRQIAVRSDRVILTSDNPRNEDPDAILRDMEVGLPDEARPTTLTITDRRQAIRTACQLAQAGDVVLIAGKGHEDYQEINGEKHHFDDREQVLEVFAAEKPAN